MSRIRRMLSAACLFCLLLSVSVNISFAQQATPSKAPIKPGIDNESDKAIPDAPVSALGRVVLDKVKPSVVQIKAFFGDNLEKNSHGSGFVIGQDGLAITNYHVVSDVVMYPNKYRLEYKSPSDQKGKVKVLAIDVLHDVALVQLEGHNAPALELMTQIPQQGERAYSVGFPLDVGLTITEGVSNGLVEDAFDERLHYAGAINGGMSGGPALDARGRVIGVNVSAYMFQQSVSFFVPARHAAALLSKASQSPLNLKEARAEVNQQLVKHAQQLFAKLPATLPTQPIKGVAMPTKLASFFDCGAGGNPENELPVQTQSNRCSAKASLYVNSNLQTGDISFNHQYFSTSKLDAWRFAHHMKRFAGGGGFRSGESWRRSDKGPNVCKQRMIKNNGIDMLATLCSRGYKKFDDLFDVTLNLTSSHKSLEAFTSYLSLTGVPYEAAMDFAERYIASIKLSDVTLAAPGAAK